MGLVTLHTFLHECDGACQPCIAAPCYKHHSTLVVMQHGRQKRLAYASLCVGCVIISSERPLPAGGLSVSTMAYCNAFTYSCGLQRNRSKAYLLAVSVHNGLDLLGISLKTFYMSMHFHCVAA
jgi:hypothetical protein